MAFLKYFSTYCFIIVFVVLNGCKNDTNTDGIKIEKADTHTQYTTTCPDYILKEKQNNLNISILLDLSDRIEHSKTIAKDSAYLSSLSKIFTTHVKRKKLILLEDKMQLFFYPEPTDDTINAIAEQLKVNFTKATSKSKLEETTAHYTTYPALLYNKAKTDAELHKGYPGCDIWRFFKDHVKDYCISPCHRNIMVILTDGYMYYDETLMTAKHKTSYLTPKTLNTLKLNTNSWKARIEELGLGFIPANSNLNALEVLVIGITSKNTKQPYAKDIIKYYWSNWFENMGIKKYKIKNAGLPSNIEKVISDFITK